jgi:hypothetical protein
VQALQKRDLHERAYLIEKRTPPKCKYFKERDLHLLVCAWYYRKDISTYVPICRDLREVHVCRDLRLYMYSTYVEIFTYVHVLYVEISTYEYYFFTWNTPLLFFALHSLHAQEEDLHSAWGSGEQVKRRLITHHVYSRSTTTDYILYIDPCIARVRVRVRWAGKKEAHYSPCLLHVL